MRLSVGSCIPSRLSVFRAAACVAAFSALLLALPSAATAQTTYAAITGTVTDSSGAVLKGAAVTATNVETGVTTKATTNSEGVYTVPQLREGPYMLSIAASGFREFIVTDLALVTRDLRHIDARLEVGGLEAAVQVTGGNAPIELDTARISDARTAEQLLYAAARTTPACGHILRSPRCWRCAAAPIRSRGANTTSRSLRSTAPP